MGKIIFEEELNKIHAEILRRKGKGFTVEVNAIVDLHEVYRRDRYINPRRQWDSKFCSIFHRNSDKKAERVDLDVSISPEVERKLPLGMTVKKTAPTVLYDNRNYLQYNGYDKHKDDLKYYELEKAVPLDRNDYKEGRRVYLTVTDECASKVLRNVFSTESSFRDLLLQKHSRILKEIIVKMDLPHRCGFQVECDRVRWNEYIGSSEYDFVEVVFKELGMEDLSSHAQLVGMALALCELLEKDFAMYGCDPRFSIYSNQKGYRIWSNKQDYVYVTYVYLSKDKSVPPPPTKELKSWD